MSKEILKITIKHNKQSRSMRLKIGKDGKPILTLPFWIPKKLGLIWANKQQDWIQQNSFTPNRFHEGQKILFLGQEVMIQHSGKHCQTHLEDGILWVSGDLEFLPRRVADFTKKEFLSYLRRQIAKKEELLEVKHTRLSLRDTSSRWGSCSSSKALNFCWRLAMAPEFVIDYMVAHEVAHLKHMHHSTHFWKTVAELTPHTYQAKKWLKQHGAELPTT